MHDPYLDQHVDLFPHDEEKDHPHPYLLHAFSLDMLFRLPCNFALTPVDFIPPGQVYIPAIGLQVVAKLVGKMINTPWEMLFNPMSVTLVPGDSVYVSRYRGSHANPDPVYDPRLLEIWHIVVHPV